MADDSSARKGVTRLCDNCQKFKINEHPRLFSTSLSAGKISLSKLTENTIEIDRSHHVLDSLPELAELAISSRRGCGLCGLLREAVLSEDTNDALKRGYGVTRKDLGVCDVWLEKLHYAFGCGGTQGLHSFSVSVVFGTYFAGGFSNSTHNNIGVQLTMRAEAVPGMLEDPPSRLLFRSCSLFALDANRVWEALTKFETTLASRIHHACPMLISTG